MEMSATGGIVIADWTKCFSIALSSAFSSCACCILVDGQPEGAVRAGTKCTHRTGCIQPDRNRFQEQKADTRSKGDSV